MRYLLLMLLSCLFTSFVRAQSAPDPAARVLQLEKQLAAYQGQVSRLEALNRTTLDFRAMLAMPVGGRWAPPLSDRGGFEERLDLWSQEGFNNVVYWINCELFGGSQCFLHLNDYPEARELDDKQVDKNGADLTAALAAAHQRHMENYLYTTVIHWTKAFGKAHNLDKPVRNELTIAYTQAGFKEMLSAFPDLDGFYGPMGEGLYGNRAAFYNEAIVPALQASGRNPRFIVHNWQVPLEYYVKEIFKWPTP